MHIKEQQSVYLHLQTAQSNSASYLCTSPADVFYSTLDCEQGDLHINEKQLRLSHEAGEALVRGTNILILLSGNTAQSKDK